MSRERDELASVLWRFHLAGPERQCNEILDAGYRKLSLDDATVERAARRIFADSGTGKADEWVYMPPEDERRIYFMNLARRALAAAVEAGK